MTCNRINNGFLCSNAIVKIGQYIVELPKIGNPMALKADGSVYARVPGGRNKFYKAVERRPQ